MYSRHSLNMSKSYVYYVPGYEQELCLVFGWSQERISGPDWLKVRISALNHAVLSRSWGKRGLAGYSTGMWLSRSDGFGRQI